MNSGCFCTEIIDHVDHGLDLIRVVHVFREVVVNLPVGQEALLLPLDDELFEFGLLALGIDRHGSPWESKECG